MVKQEVKVICSCGIEHEETVCRGRVNAFCESCRAENRRKWLKERYDRIHSDPVRWEKMLKEAREYDKTPHRREYNRDYRRNRYDTDPEFRKRVTETSRRSFEKRRKLSK